jgi:hypothetical protein
MEAASTSETSVNFYQTTRHNNPEDNHLHTRRSENLKPHFFSTAKIILKGKMIPLHAMEAHGVRGGIASTHSYPRH